MSDQNTIPSPARPYSPSSFLFTFEDVDGNPVPRIPFSGCDGAGFLVDNKRFFHFAEACKHFNRTGSALRQLWYEEFPWVRSTQKRFEDQFGIPVPVQLAGYHGDSTDSLMTIPEAAVHFKTTEEALSRLWEKVFDEDESEKKEKKDLRELQVEDHHLIRDIISNLDTARSFASGVMLRNLKSVAEALYEIQNEFEIPIGDPRDQIAGAIEQIESALESTWTAIGDLCALVTTDAPHSGLHDLYCKQLSVLLNPPRKSKAGGKKTVKRTKAA